MKSSICKLRAEGKRIKDEEAKSNTMQQECEVIKEKKKEI